jgi:hypothetical protein
MDAVGRRTGETGVRRGSNVWYVGLRVVVCGYIWFVLFYNKKRELIVYCVALACLLSLSP